MKKQALGSTPTFENVAKATLKNDLFTDAEIEEAKIKLEEEKEKEQIIEVYDPFKDPKAKEIVEKTSLKQKLKDYNTTKEKEDFKQLIKEKAERTENEARENTENRKNKETSKNEKKPSTERRLAEGYIRATFEVNKEQLELIKALADFKEIKQKDLLEVLLETGLAKINKDTKEQALNSYRTPKENKKNKKTIQELFN